MPVLTPWDARLGIEQGRIEPANAIPLEGDRVFVLGSDRPGVEVKATVGDFLEIEQTGSVTGVRLVVVRARLRAPELSGDLAWKLALMLNGAEKVSTTLHRPLTLTDFALPIGALTGDQRIGMRLELTGTAGSYSVELPGVYLDSLGLDTAAAGLVLANRDGAPGDVDFPIDRSIRLEIIDALGTVAVTAAATSVYVNGVLAFSAGTFQTGFTGPESAQDATIHGGFGLRLTIDPTTLLASESQVSVRVVSSNANGTIDETWSFVTEDVTAPTVTGALAIGRKTVRVEFSEPMTRGDETDPVDMLRVANYALSIASTSIDDGLPAMAVEVIAVEEVTSSSVVLTTDTEMTRGALYRVVVSDVEDENENALESPTNVALFYGYQCPQPPGREFLIADWIPDLNLSEDTTRDLEKFLAVIQEVIDLLLCDIDHWTDILDPDTAPEEFVDVMLLDLGNPFEFELTLIEKRTLVQLLVPIFKQKGTAPGIINTIRLFMGIDVSISYPAFSGWDLGVSELGFDTYLGTDDIASRFSYTIHSPISLTDDQRTKMTKIATYMHAVNEHLIEITEPDPPPEIPDHWELGLSELGTESALH